MTLAHQHWLIIQRLINTFWPPLKSTDGVTSVDLDRAQQRLRLTLPQAIREYYTFAGQRYDFIGNEDHLLPIDKLRIVDDYLIFCDENQGVVSWGIATNQMHLSNPPVMVDNDEIVRTWSLASPSFSEFMLGMVAYATMLSGKFTGYGTVTTEQTQQIESHYDLFDENAIVGKLFGDAQTLICWQIQKEEQSPIVLMAAQTKIAMSMFLNLVGKNWGETSHNSQGWMHNYSDDCEDVPPLYIVRHPIQDDLETPGVFPPCHLNSHGPTMSAYPHSYFEHKDTESRID